MPEPQRKPLVGFYVHYHGLGHKHRTEAILDHLDSRSVVLTSRIANQRWSGKNLEGVIDLPCDIDDVPPDGWSRSRDVDCFHHAPLGAANCTERVAAFSRWAQREKPDLIVVDVSAEITLLARLLGLPAIVVRQSGERIDPAHLMVFQSAEKLLCPYPEILENPATPGWVRAKTVYTPGFCRFHGTPPSRAAARNRLGLGPEARIALSFTGSGSQGNNLSRMVAAANRSPDWLWLAIGKTATGQVDQAEIPGNLKIIGWVDSPLNYLAAADVVVSATGNNSAMEIGYSRKPMIAIPEQRPFGEQRCKAQSLERAGVAIALADWQPGRCWSSLLERALHLETAAWEKIVGSREDEGSARAAEAIDGEARRCHDLWAADGGMPDPRPRTLPSQGNLDSPEYFPVNSSPKPVDWRSPEPESIRKAAR